MLQVQQNGTFEGVAVCECKAEHSLQRRDIRASVLLSPKIDPIGVTTNESLQTHGNEAAWLRLYCEGDSLCCFSDPLTVAEFVQM